MGRHILSLLVAVPLAMATFSIAACESSSNNSSSGGTSGSSGNLPDSGDVTADGSMPPTDGGTPPVDAAAEAEAGPLPPAACKWTASGAMSATGPCMFNVAYTSSDNNLGFAMNGTPDQVSFGGKIAGATTLVPGTYTLADMPEAGGLFIVPTTSIWAMCNNGGCTDGQGNNVPNQGTFTLTITSAGAPTSAGGTNMLWSAAHGVLDMVLPFDPNTTSSGTVNMHVTF